MTAFITAHLPLIILCLLAVNFITFILFGVDKRRARRHRRRIPEATLFFFAVIFGAAGALCGMKFFRHKTLHASFRIGIPLLLIIQLVIFIVLFFLCV